MPFTAADMESGWTALMNAQGDSEWVDVVQSSTGEYYRLPLTNGGLRHWNRTTGVWEVPAVAPAGLIPVTVRFLG